MSVTGAPAVSRCQSRGSRSAAELLEWGRSQFDPPLREAVEGLPASVTSVAGYHLGWYDERGRPAAGDGGKALRPTLTLLSARAVGAISRAAVAAAVAVELVHNFSLLHDDVMDRDPLRRHRPTAWAVFGADAAILAGDALLALASRVLAATGHASSAAGVEVLSDAVTEMIAGQHADLGFERRSDVGMAECMAMSRQKTGALMTAACALGGLFGGGTPAQVDALGEFGADVGLAFQIIDDLLGIWGDPAVTGKPIHSDVRSRKKSSVVAAALASGTRSGRELAALYEQPEPLSADAVTRAVELIEDAGARRWGRATADALFEQAMCAVEAVEGPPEAADDLRTVARFVTRRSA